MLSHFKCMWTSLAVLCRWNILEICYTLHFLKKSLETRLGLAVCEWWESVYSGSKGSRYLRHKLFAGLNLIGPNATIKVTMSQVLQATGAAQWSTRIDRKEMNVCNLMVVTCFWKEKPTCHPSVVSLLGLQLKVCVWVTVRWHDTAKELRRRLCLIFPQIKIIPRYSKSCYLLVLADHFFCKFHLQEKQNTLKNKIRNFEWSFCTLLFSLCFYHLFTESEQNLTSPQAGWVVVSLGGVTGHYCIYITRWSVIKGSTEFLSAHPEHQNSALEINLYPKHMLKTENLEKNILMIFGSLIKNSQYCTWLFT